MNSERKNDLDSLIALILKYNTPFTMDDLHNEWKSFKNKSRLESTDKQLIKYVLSSMCENGQVIYREGAYNIRQILIASEGFIPAC